MLFTEINAAVVYAVSTKPDIEIAWYHGQSKVSLTDDVRYRMDSENCHVPTGHHGHYGQRRRRLALLSNQHLRTVHQRLQARRRRSVFVTFLA